MNNSPSLKRYIWRKTNCQLKRFVGEQALDEDRDLFSRTRMLKLANDRWRFGSPHRHELLRREDLVQNHKLIEKICQKESLSLHTRKRVNRPSHARIVQTGPAGRDEQWAMDFASNSLMGGRRIRILTIADLWDHSARRSKWICRCLECGQCAFLKGYVFKAGCRSVLRLITARIPCPQSTRWRR
ncbi:MAG TPA: hypothetical protein VEZ52_07545 [Desulfovibrio sp.]|uniref:hypothetical protein n=1 Tax=Desulfovibrio sp. TaxID=885 RepID=UPI002D57C103|nr:hypothetical protein [Desulfovibrio sp.]HZF61461.1 hypothetical protein [Desulfovibrio sp.]